MNIELTLQEKLRDLRDEKKIRLIDLAEETGIPLSSLQRIEGQDDVRVGYQDLTALAEFYDVSTDFLFGITDNRQHRNVEVDSLRLSDSAIETLKSDNFNHRLLSEMISHPDFSKVMSAIEVYVDRKIVPQMNTINAMYKLVEKGLREKFDVADNDEVIAILGEAIVDDDEYLRYRITERFSELMKSLFDIHKKDIKPDKQADVLNDIKAAIDDYPHEENDEVKAKCKYVMLTKQLGLNTSHLSDEENRVLMKALSKSDLHNRCMRHRKRKR
jgi:transcriptional regulator with XRE-family HTH domain